MNIRNTIEDNRKLFKKVLLIAIPIMIQNGFTNFVNLLDNIMVGRLGTEPMSGVAIVTQLIFIFNLCIFGGFSGAGIFTSQYNGKNDQEGVRNTFRFKFILGIILVLLAVLVFEIFGDRLIGFYLHESEDGGDLALTLSCAREYLNVILFSLPGFALVQCYASTMRECGQTVVPMRAGIAAVLVNLFFNWVFIFGNLGMPEMGVRGAALATVISRYVELSVIMVWAHRHTDKLPFASGLYRTLRVPANLISRISSKGMILLVNELMWSLGLSLISQCYSLRGLNAVAGVNIAETLNNLFKVVFLAFGNSVGIIVGALLGAGKMEEAVETDRRIIGYSVIISSFIGLIMFLFSGLFPQIYNTNDSARAIASSLIVLQAIFLPVEAFKNATYFTVRSGGRTFVTFLFDGFSMIAVSYPAAFILSRFTEAPVTLIFLSVQLTGLLKCLVGYILVKKRVWVRNIVTESK
ncbi:MAG: MATE family efflux transporter [Sphaerochaetaceae bacterium]|nr:MATE family efflux transporter [Sphaerochaetaceae bacterium]